MRDADDVIDATKRIIKKEKNTRIQATSNMPSLLDDPINYGSIIKTSSENTNNQEITNHHESSSGMYGV